MASQAAAAASAAASRARVTAGGLIVGRGSTAAYDSCQARCTGPNTSCFSTRVRSLHSSPSAASPGACRAAAAAAPAPARRTWGCWRTGRSCSASPPPPPRRRPGPRSPAPARCRGPPAEGASGPRTCRRPAPAGWPPPAWPRWRCRRGRARANRPGSTGCPGCGRRGKVKGPLDDVRPRPSGRGKQRLGHVDREERTAGAGQPVPLGVGYALLATTAARWYSPTPHSRCDS